MSDCPSYAADRLCSLNTDEAKALALKWGVTLKQFRVYALALTGHRRSQIALILGMWRPNVSACLSRALKRNPQLPQIPYRTGRRRR